MSRITELRTRIKNQFIDDIFNEIENEMFPSNPVASLAIEKRKSSAKAAKSAPKRGPGGRFASSKKKIEKKKAAAKREVDPDLAEARRLNG